MKTILSFIWNEFVWRTTYIFVLIRSDGNKLGLWENEYIDIVKSSHRYFRVIRRWMSCLNDVKTRNVFMHRIQDDLNCGEILVNIGIFSELKYWFFFLRVHSDPSYCSLVLICWTIMAVSLVVRLLSYYRGADKNDQALEVW